MVEAGQVVSGKYKLLRLLGDGGMGSVFEAEHLALGTRVAIKVLHADLARRANIAERFVQEARVSAQIRSAHVVQVTDVDRTPDGVAYLVMELLQGEPLSGVMRRERRLAVGTACEYTSQILQALEAAHSLGVIHRDLKPDNVFVTFQGGKPILKLIDFGIAKLKTAQAGQKNLTVAGMLMGTPEYMAPEQAYSADKVDVRADLYAVGVMLYEMLAGQPPTTADDPRVLIGKVERGEVTPLVQAAPGIEPHLAGFVHRAMAPRPELRFANATEMRVTLEEILTGKKWGTAKLAASPSAAPAALAPQAAPPPPVVQQPMEPPRAEFRTGTVMGAPVDGALTPPGPDARGGATMGGGGPPVMMHSPPPHYVAHGGPPHYEATAPPKRGGSGVVIILAVVAALLGAGAVVAYVVGTQQSEPAVPVVLPTTPTSTTPTPATAAPAASPAAAPPVTPATPLAPATNVAPSPPTQPAAKKDAGTVAPDNKLSFPDAGLPMPTVTVDAGSGQTTIVTPFGTFEFPGPRPPFYPADQPWPPPNILPMPK